MKIVEDKIVEITEEELYRLYLERDMDIFMTFPEYVRKFKELGTKVIKDED